MSLASRTRPPLSPIYQNDGPAIHFAATQLSAGQALRSPHRPTTLMVRDAVPSGAALTIRVSRPNPAMTRSKCAGRLFIRTLTSLANRHRDRNEHQESAFHRHRRQGHERDRAAAAADGRADHRLRRGLLSAGQRLSEERATFRSRQATARRTFPTMPMSS